MRWKPHAEDSRVLRPKSEFLRLHDCIHLRQLTPTLLIFKRKINFYFLKTLLFWFLCYMWPDLILTDKASFQALAEIPKVLSCVWLFATPWTVTHQAPLCMAFFRQEYWSGLPCSRTGDLPNPGIKPMPLASPAMAGRFFTTSITWEAPENTKLSL